jgi:hypothetical protein
MRRLTLVLVAILALSLVAVAQDYPRLEVSAGYRYSRVQEGAPTSFVGVNYSGVGASATFNFNRALGAFVDFGQMMCTKSGVDMNGMKKNQYRQTSFLFGPQFTYHGEARLSPFARFYIGIMRANKGYVVGSGPNEFVTLAADQTKWADGIGGGVDMRLTKMISARLAQVDYIRSHFADYHQSNTRITVGITIKLGGGKTK